MSFRKAIAFLAKLGAVLVPVGGGIALAVLIAPILPAAGLWVESAGSWAPVVFILLYTVVVVLMLPAFLLIIAGGAVFGVTKGALLSLAGATTGSLASFLIARYVARNRVERWMKGHPRLQVADQSIEEEGLRLVFLLRLSPAVPFVLSNYALGISRLRLSHFVLGTVGLAPVVFAYAAYGALAGSAVTTGRVPFPPWVIAIGVIATIVLAVILARIVRRALDAPGRSS